MKLIKLAVLGAAAYGAKKWLDENPNAKRQVREAADNAKVQAKHAVDTAKQEVDKRRHGDESGYGDDVDGGYTPDSETPTSSMFGTGDTEATASSAPAGLGAEVPNTQRTS